MLLSSSFFIIALVAAVFDAVVVHVYDVVCYNIFAISALIVFGFSRYSRTKQKLTYHSFDHFRQTKRRHK